MQSDFCDNINSIESITKDNYNINGFNNSINKTSNGNVCCRGFESCRSEELSSKTIRIGNNSKISNFDSGNLMCNGYHSCESTNLDNRGVEYGNIYCNGDRSCGSLIIYSHSNGNVHCSGRRSCVSNVILNAKNVYCSGT